MLEFACVRLEAANRLLAFASIDDGSYVCDLFVVELPGPPQGLHCLRGLHEEHRHLHLPRPEWGKTNTVGAIAEFIDDSYGRGL